MSTLSEVFISTIVLFNPRISIWFLSIIFISWWMSSFYTKKIFSWFPLVIYWPFPLALWEFWRQLMWSFCLVSPMSKSPSGTVFIRCVHFLLRGYIAIILWFCFLLLLKIEQFHIIVFLSQIFAILTKI